MKNLILLLLFFQLNISFSQLDTNAIFSEIRALSSDSEIDQYWIKLDSSDQDLHTFCKPITQIENLVKAIYFFKIFGFTSANRFNSNYEMKSQPEMHSQIIWIHNGFNDFNYMTFGLINECHKIYKSFDYNYLFQGVYSSHSKFDNQSLTDLKGKCFQQQFKDIDIKKTVEIANEYIFLINELYKEKPKEIKIIGSWEFENNIIKIIKYKSAFYCTTEAQLLPEQAKLVRNVPKNIYFNTFQLIAEKNQKFKIKFNSENEFYQIDKEGSLINYTKDGKILQTFSEYSYN